MVPYPSGIVTDNIRGEWIPNGSVISHNGRAYSFDNDAVFDWAGGVVPGSWEWRVYYMTAWGDPRRGEDFFETHENYEWGPPASENNVIMDIEVFYDQIFPGDLRVADSIDKTASDDPRHLTYYPVTTDDGRSMMSTLDPVEDSLFDGLAALTKGRYIKVKKGEPLPILGDVNRDGKVNETDLRSVYTWFGRPVDYYNQGSVNADINLDAFVDNADMSYVRENWNDKTKPAPIHGDVDYNRCVDEADYKQVMQWYGKKVDPNSQHSYHADLNADGVIDYLDVNIVKGNMYKGCGNNDETCEDGIENGDETDIDCGGEDCEGCEIGQKCYDNEDCKSKSCKNGICVKNFIAELTAEVKVYTDWKNGYCANIEITNRNSYPTKTWTVGLNTNQSTIYTSWNGKYSGTFGEIKVEPADWNRVINPGQKIVSPGFCANKFFGGTAEVTFARGSY